MITNCIIGALFGSVIALIISLVRTTKKLKHEIHLKEDFRGDLARTEAKCAELNREMLDMKAHVRGERVACELCKGCDNLIVSQSPTSLYSSYPVIRKAYKCKKNLRCKEYEVDGKIIGNAEKACSSAADVVE